MRPLLLAGRSPALVFLCLVSLAAATAACGDDASPGGSTGSNQPTGSAGAGNASGTGGTGNAGGTGNVAGTSSTGGSGGVPGAAGSPAVMLSCDRSPPKGVCDDPAFGYCIEDPNLVPSCLQGQTPAATCPQDKRIGYCVYPAGYSYNFYEGGDSLANSQSFCKSGGGLFCPP